MHNACIVLQKKINPSDRGVNAVLGTFSASGYSLSEVRFLLQSDAQSVKQALKTLKESADTIVLLADKMALPIAKGYFAEYFNDNTAQNIFGSAGVYRDKKTSLFLLSADETETGVGYVKNVCVPYLQQLLGVRYDKMVIRTVGANEERVRGLLAQVDNMSGNRLSYQHTRKHDEDVIEIAYDSNTPRMLTDDVLRMLADGFGDTVYALNSDATLEEQLVTLLKLRRRKISVAESFTGGGIAKRITSVSGASEVYFEGLNTYDELSKIKRLGVSEYTLQTSGAVSDQTAYEMATGLLNTGCCDIAIATTGLAGPKTDRSMLPVGLCFIAVGVKEQVLVYRYKFDGNREEITEKAINYALYLAYKHLKNL